MDAFRLLFVLALLLVLLPIGDLGFCGCENPADAGCCLLGCGCSGAVSAANLKLI